MSSATFSLKHYRNIKTDLHVHSKASDGAYTPGELVKLAFERNIKILSLTDHDTIHGLQEASETAKEYGVAFIPGIEFSTVYYDREVHILGYNFVPDSPVLTNALNKLSAARENRARKIIEKLNKLGYPITFSEVKAKSDSEIIGRPHIALAMIEHGIVSSIEEGFAKFLGPEGVAFVPRFKISPREAVQLIKEAGGLAVLAHPSNDFPSEHLPEFINYGLDGIEVYHPKNSPHISDYYYRRAVEAGLLITGGSDFHGHDADDFNNLGALPADPETLCRLLGEEKSLE